MEAKIKKILESTFAYNVENDRVAEEIDSLYKEQRDELLKGLKLVLKDIEWFNNSPTKKHIEKLIKNCK